MTLFLIFFVNALLAQTAIEPSGSGDIGDPFLINSLENLYWLTSNQSVWGTGYYFSQTADILAKIVAHESGQKVYVNSS